MCQLTILDEELSINNIYIMQNVMQIISQKTLFEDSISNFKIYNRTAKISNHV